MPCLLITRFAIYDSLRDTPRAAAILMLIISLFVCPRCRYADDDADYFR